MDKNLRVLVLEDNEERCKLFCKNMSDWDISIVDDVKELKNLLSESKWDVLFLDCELNRVKTGLDAAIWLSENPDKKPKLVILHSSNHVSVDKMRGYLSNSYPIPFIWARPDLKECLIALYNES